MSLLRDIRDVETIVDAGQYCSNHWAADHSPFERYGPTYDWPDRDDVRRIAYACNPVLEHGEPYRPMTDVNDAKRARITMPYRKFFADAEDYYKVLFHEMSHAVHMVMDTPWMASTTAGATPVEKAVGEGAAEFGSYLCCLSAGLNKPTFPTIAGWYISTFLHGARDELLPGMRKLIAYWGRQAHDFIMDGDDLSVELSREVVDSYKEANLIAALFIDNETTLRSMMRSIP